MEQKIRKLDPYISNTNVVLFLVRLCLMSGQMIDIWMSCPSLFPVQSYLILNTEMQLTIITIYIASYSYWSLVITPSHWLIFAAYTQILFLHRRLLIRNILKACLWKLGVQVAGPLEFIQLIHLSLTCRPPTKLASQNNPTCVYMANKLCFERAGRQC